MEVDDLEQWIAAIDNQRFNAVECSWALLRLAGGFSEVEIHPAETVGLAIATNGGEPKVYPLVGATGRLRMILARVGWIVKESGTSAEVASPYGLEGNLDVSEPGGVVFRLHIVMRNNQREGFSLRMVRESLL